MNIFLLVWDGGYDGYGEPAVFSSKEKAKEYFKTLRGWSKDEYTIIEKEVDNPECESIEWATE